MSEQDTHADGQNDEADAVAEPESGCPGDSVGNPGGSEAEGESIAAAQSDAPQCQDIEQCGLENDFVGSQNIGAGELDGVEKQQAAQERKEQRGAVCDGNIGSVKMNDEVFSQPDDTGDGDGKHCRQPCSGCGNVSCLVQLSCPDGLCDECAGGAGKRQGEHVEDAGKVGDDLVASDGIDAQPRDEQGHEGE